MRSLPVGGTSEIKRQKGGEGRAKVFTQWGKKQKSLEAALLFISLSYYDLSKNWPWCQLSHHYCACHTLLPLLNHFKRSTKWVMIRCCQSAPAQFLKGVKWGQQSGWVKSRGPQCTTGVPLSPGFCSIWHCLPMFYLFREKFTRPRFMKTFLL